LETATTKGKEITMKEIKLRQKGWTIEGEALLSLWGGGEGYIPMDKRFIPLGKLTKENLHRCINDGRFGCESILSATCHISIAFGEFDMYERAIEISKPNQILVYRGI